MGWECVPHQDAEPLWGATLFSDTSAAGRAPAFLCSLNTTLGPAKINPRGLRWEADADCVMPTGAAPPCLHIGVGGPASLLSLSHQPPVSPSRRRLAPMNRRMAPCRKSDGLSRWLTPAGGWTRSWDRVSTGHMRSSDGQCGRAAGPQNGSLVVSSRALEDDSRPSRNKHNARFPGPSRLSMHRGWGWRCWIWGCQSRKFPIVIIMLNLRI